LADLIYPARLAEKSTTALGTIDIKLVDVPM